MADKKPNETEQPSQSDILKLASKEAQQQLEINNALYRKMSESIKELGFEKAVEQAKKYTAAIKEITDNQGNLDSSLKALKSELETVSDAMSNANEILSNYPMNLAEATKKYEEAYAKQEAIRAAGATRLQKELADETGFAEKKAEFLESEKKKLQEIADLKEKLAKDKYDTNLQDQIEKAQSEAKTIKAKLLEIAAAEAANKKLRETVALEIEKAEIEREMANSQITRIKLLAQEAAAYMPLLDYEKLRVKSINDASTGMANIVDRLTGANTQSTMLTNIFFGMKESVVGAGGGIKSFFSNVTQGMIASFLEPEKAFNRIVSFIDERLIKSTREFDKTLADVGKNTGGFRKEFEDVAIKMGGVTFTNLSEYGVDIKKYGEAYVGLSRNIGGFNNMMDSQRKVLTDSAATMTTLGVSVDNYGKLVSKFMGSIGKSAEGARDMINKLAADAIALGKDVSQYTSEFESAMSRISGYGKEATQIFKELNAVSAATRGVVTSQDLLSISDKFKDFDSAADSVSKLNAMLGGTSVNILDMMRADPSEQIMMIKRAAGEAGLQFDKLNIGYKRLLAEYFSGDINKAQAFFNADMATAQRDFIANEKQLEERKKANVAYQEKLDALMSNMKVVLTPLIDLMNKFVSVLTPILSKPGTALTLTFLTLGGLVTALYRGLTFVKVTAEEVKASFIGAAEQSAAAFAALQARLDAVSSRLAAINGQIATTNIEATALNATTGGLGAGGAAGDLAKKAATTGVLGRAAGAIGGFASKALPIAMIGMLGYSLFGMAGESLDESLKTGKYRQKGKDEIAIEAGEITTGTSVKPNKNDKLNLVGNTIIASKNEEYTSVLTKGIKSAEVSYESVTKILETTRKSVSDFTTAIFDYTKTKEEQIVKGIGAAVSEPIKQAFSTTDISNVSQTGYSTTNIKNMYGAQQQPTFILKLPAGEIGKIADIIGDIESPLKKA